MPRCKCCKDKFEPKYFNQKFCMDKDECISAFTIWAKDHKDKAEQKDWNKRRKQMDIKVNPVKYKKKLQDNINKLARMVDERFKLDTCIDCGKPFGKQKDGGHFNSVGSNPTLRFNLHNIHTQKSDCNQNGLGGGRRLEYYRGLAERYNQEYADYVDTGLQIKYKYLGLSEQDIYDKYILTNKLIRDFNTFAMKDPRQGRELLNKLIGIYG